MNSRTVQKVEVKLIDREVAKALQNKMAAAYVSIQSLKKNAKSTQPKSESRRFVKNAVTKALKSWSRSP